MLVQRRHIAGPGRGPRGAAGLRLRALPRAALLSASLVALGGAAACGGGDSPTTPKPPVEKTCAEDPTQAKCNTPPPSTQTLAAAASAKGRYFGTAVDALFTAATPSAAYMSTLGKEFNALTPGNVTKWEPLRRNGRDAAYRYTWPDSMVAYAAAKGWKVHGHTLAWHQQNPPWLTQGASSAAWTADTLNAILKEHITNVVGHFKGKVFAWDVVNEALADNGSLRQEGPWAPKLGKAYIETAFRTARAADPNAELLYNDYNLEYPGAKQDSAYALVSDLKAKGILDGIGFQAHFLVNADGGGMPSRASLTATFQRFAALGIKVHVTELDIRIAKTGATQAAVDGQTRGWGDVVAACLAVSACEGITVWGISDAESWIDGTFPGWGQALLWDASYTKKAGYSAVLTALTQ